MTIKNLESVLDIFVNSRPALIGYVVNILKSPKDAEDVVQEAYLRLANGKPREKIDHPKAFVFRVARNLALDHLKREKRRETSLELNGSQLSAEAEVHSPEGWLLADEKRRIMLEAILSLPTKCRRVYTLRKMYDMSHREIADSLGISVRTVENHIAKATRDCRRYLMKHHEESQKNALDTSNWESSGRRNFECC